jgi:hypothetical protein
VWLGGGGQIRLVGKYVLGAMFAFWAMSARLDWEGAGFVRRGGIGKMVTGIMSVGWWIARCVREMARVPEGNRENEMQST